MTKRKIRCWKKEHSSRKLTRYAHINTPAEVEIFTERIDGKSVPFVAVTDEDSIKDKEFKTKKKAMEFAKRYMRNHDDGC